MSVFKNSGKISIQEKVLSFLYKTSSGRILLKILIRPEISAAAGKFMDSRLSIPIIKPFIRYNNIDMSQFENCRYNSFNEFFTRKIKPECRKIDMDKKALISPCDGKLSVFDICDNSRFMIKGSEYSVSELFQSKRAIEKYRGGKCLIFRLSVDDYHRYCYIDNGEKTGNRYIPGEFHTVNPIACESCAIYKRNSREYTIMRTENFGDTAEIEVGAMLVGRIRNNAGAGKMVKGEEKGRFEYGGSTIILMFEKDKIELDGEIADRAKKGEIQVRYGQKIGQSVDQSVFT